MARIADSLSRFLGRVEILARGADEDRRAAAKALAEDKPLLARSRARALLERVPRSPVGLALWADAAEACGFDAEVLQALEPLLAQMPWQHDVWLRYGEAAQRSDPDKARAALERATRSDNQATVRRALLLLADGELADKEVVRAERWLDRVAYHPSVADPELALRRAECAIARGDMVAAARWEKQMRSLTEGGRVRLVRAHLAAVNDDASQGDHPVSLALAALVLETPGADELLARLVAECHDAVLIDRVRQTLVDVGRFEEPAWQAAFALAEGRSEDARAALIRSVRSGDGRAAAALYELALMRRDEVALHECAEHAPERLGERAQALQQWLSNADQEGIERVEALQPLLGDDPIGEWAATLLASTVAAWLPAGDHTARWEVLLTALSKSALRHGRMDLVADIEQLAIERQRPLYVAVLGEFNAGKSTMLNALLSTDVAPTGVRPTTGSLHWVAWAPDPFARVVIEGAGDRVVVHDQLKAVIEQLAERGQHLERAYIYAPIERLKRIEIIDTPGFNAPDPRHAEQAWRGIREAHVALWLLDATAPLKDSERRVVEAIMEAGVPVQVVINKRDRLNDSQREQVMRYVKDALQEVGLPSLRPPLMLSARQALKGRLGDDEALAASGWAAFEQLLSEEIVDRRDVLRERALRRKAAAIAAQLEQLERQEREQAMAAWAEQRARTEQIRALAARLRAERIDLAVRLGEQLRQPLARLADDLRPLGQLDAEQRNSTSMRRYLIERTVTRLAEPLRAHLLKQLDSAHDVRLGQAALVASLTGSVSVHGQPLAGEVLQHALQAAVEALAEAIDEQLAREATQRAPAGQMLSGAIAQALQGEPAEAS